MTKRRYNQLMRDEDAQLTDEEKKEGWHFCWEWDFLLVGPKMREMEACTCHKKVREICTERQGEPQ